MGITNEIKLAQERAKTLGVPLADLAGKLISPQILREVTEEAATFYQFVPMEKKGRLLEVGMLNPDDLKSQEAVRFIAQNRNFEPKIFLITDSDFKNVLKQYRTLKEEVDTALSELEKELSVKDEPQGEDRKLKAEAALERVMAEAPITKIVAVILRHANEGRASDIHIEPTEERLRIRFRVDGVLYTSLLLPRAVHPAVVSRIKILSNLKIDEMRVPQDGRFHSVIDSQKIDFRVSTFPTSFGEKVVLRLLDPTQGVKTFESLGLDGRNRQVVEEAMARPFGMILLSGPTGSGKTTTLYAILKTLNQEEVNVVSLEDPVEYFIEGVSQSQIKPEIGYTFASGLRSILRQDPDVILIGEIRDNETAEIAMHAALTGHLVFSTLHTNEAAGTIPRLLDMKVQAAILAPALNLSIAQRLVRKLCVFCRKKVKLAPEETKKIQEIIAKLPERVKKPKLGDEIEIFEAGVGCEKCSGTGYKGRIAVLELFLVDPEIQEMINQPQLPTIIKLKELAVKKGMVRMEEDAILKILAGLTSISEAETVLGRII